MVVANIPGGGGKDCRQVYIEIALVYASFQTLFSLGAGRDMVPNKLRRFED